MIIQKEINYSNFNMGTFFFLKKKADTTILSVKSPMNMDTISSRTRKKLSTQENHDKRIVPPPKPTINNVVDAIIIASYYDTDFEMEDHSESPLKYDYDSTNYQEIILRENNLHFEQYGSDYNEMNEEKYFELTDSPEEPLEFSIDLNKKL